MADPIQIAYAIVANGFAPNNCQANTTYLGQTITAHGDSWDDAKANVISRCMGMKALGDIPVSETVDLDVPA